MKKAEIMNTLTRKFYRVGFKFKKHSPEILVGAGVVGVVASAVMACKATTKLDDVLAETKDTVDKIHDVTEHPEKIPEGKEYTVEDSKKDLTIVYTQAGVKLVKLYGPAVVLGTVSIAAIIGGHHILRKRNIALAAAYTAVDKGFKEYRGRVLERFGEEVDKELRYNIKAKEIEKTVTDGICNKLDTTIDNVSKSIDVDVPDYIVQEAIDKAVERRVQQETINAVRKISKKIEDDIDLKVRTEIDVKSSAIRQEVKNKISEEVAKISADDIANEIREEAKEKVAEKFDNELDDILSEFNNNLEHVSKIYSSIADKMAGIGSNKDFKISLG